MPYLIESNEWRLVRELGRLFDQRKTRYCVQPGPLNYHKRVHPNAELIEVELRRAFMVKEFPRNLDPTEFEQCRAKLNSLCLLLNDLASDQSPHGGPEGQAYPRLRTLAAFLESTSGAVDLVNGPNETLFRLPCDADKLCDCLRIVTDCNDVLGRLLAAPAQELAMRPLQRQQKRRWKKAIIRNRAKFVLGAVFEHFRCDTPHEVLLKLMEDPDKDSVLPSLQLMLSRCPELELWQEARCDSVDLGEASISSIPDICTDLQKNTGQERALVLYIEKYGLFGAWAGSTSSTGPSSKESLDQLITEGAFEPLSRDINALLRGASPAKFSTKDKRALAVKLGFCLMDFFDADLNSKRIYFLNSSNSGDEREFPYLAFSSKLPTTAESHNFRMGHPHPALLSFAKLLLEMDCGQTIDLDISSRDSRNLHAWAKLLDIVNLLEEDRSDSYLKAIRGCLLVHQKIAKALSPRALECKDTDSRIRRKLYKEVVKNLELGLAESIPRSTLKRQRPESPPPSDRWDGAQTAGSWKTAKYSIEPERTAPGCKRRHTPEPRQWPLPGGRGVVIQLEKEAVSTASPPVSRNDFEIAIVCALPLEYDAVSLLVDQFWDDDGDPYGRAVGDANTYATGRIGKFDVVLALLSNMGKVSAASWAVSLRSSWPGLRLVLLTGICGGVPNPGTDEELLLGDVVISKTVIQYDHGRRFPDDFATKDTVEDALGRPTKNIRNLVRIFETDRARERLEQRAAFFLQQLQEKSSGSRRRANYQYPGAENDRLFEANFRHKHHLSPQCLCANCHGSSDLVCDESRKLSCDELGCDIEHIVLRQRLEMKRQLERDGRSMDAQAPSVFVGRVGSGDMVLKSGEDRDRIAKRHGILAFEMEGAGVLDEIPCIVAKGVCDYADSHKNKSWQAFAAATAASVAKALLERYTKTDNPFEGTSNVVRQYIAPSDGY